MIANLYSFTCPSAVAGIPSIALGGGGAGGRGGGGGGGGVGGGVG